MPRSQPDFASALAASFEQIRDRFDSELASVRASARREVTAELNNAVRRLQQADTPDVRVRTLLDAAAPFCAQAACFRIEGSRVLLEATSDAEAEPPAIEFDLDAAPAFANAAESRDVVVAAAVASQLSEDVLTLLQPKGQKIYLFPLVKQDRTVGILCADPGETDVDVSGLELLASVAALTLVPAPPPKPANLVVIEGAKAAARPVAALRPEWSDLSPSEQQIHLRAQRFARTRISDLILNKMEKVRNGRTSRDLYGTLRIDIDAGRETFRREFVHTCPSMVDYYHLELVRTLAQNDPDLLGPDYPGPLP